jgi:glucan phosphorylase
MAYDNPIPGFGTNNTINLRLWAAKPDREFDLQAFNTGDYVQVGCSLAGRWLEELAGLACQSLRAVCIET